MDGSTKSSPPNASAMTAYKQENNSDMTHLTFVKEEQTSSDESQIKEEPKTRRHRASVACTACRDRRIRCVVPSGEKTCFQCERSGTACVIKDDDERRRPISRAYVYSLVERIALLEGLLEDNGLAVPPASHPPETLHRSRRSKETSSVDHTPSSSSTTQDGNISESHTVPSPYNSGDQIRDDRSATRPMKRSSIHLEPNVADHYIGKRTRHDSLIMSANIKIESPMQDPISAVTHLSGTHELDQFAMLPPPDPTSLWPTAHEDTSSQTTTYSTLQSARIDSCAFSAWGGGAFDFQSYDQYSLESQHQGLFHAKHRYTGVSRTAGGTTNLDFMPLSTSS